jgi:hypothetical protein
MKRLVLLTLLVGLTACQRAYQRGYWEGLGKAESWHHPFESDQENELKQYRNDLAECRAHEKLDFCKVELNICRATLADCECK